MNRIWPTIALVLSLTCPVSSAAESKQLTELREVLKVLQGSYEKLIRSNWRNRVDSYFLFRSQDITQTAKHLASRSRVGAERVAELRAKLGAGFEVKPKSIEQRAMVVRGVLLEARRAAGEAAVLLNDFEYLSKAWAERCSERMIRHAEMVFEPRTLFSADIDAIRSVRTGWVTAFQISSGNVHPATRLQSASSGEVGSMGATVGMALGASTGSMGSVLGPVGMVVGFAVGTIIDSVARAEDFETQLRIISEIWEFQNSKIAALAGDTPRLLRERCEQQMPELVETDSGSGAAAAQGVSVLIGAMRMGAERYLLESNQLAVHARIEEEDLKKLFQADLERVLSVGTESVRVEALHQLEKTLRNSSMNERSATDFIENTVNPRARLTAASEYVVEKDELRQVLWDAMIEGDTKFSFDLEFTFHPHFEPSIESAGKGSLRWISAVQSIKQRALK